MNDKPTIGELLDRIRKHAQVIKKLPSIIPIVKDSSLAIIELLPQLRQAITALETDCSELDHQCKMQMSETVKVEMERDELQKLLNRKEAG